MLLRQFLGGQCRPEVPKRAAWDFYLWIWAELALGQYRCYIVYIIESITAYNKGLLMKTSHECHCHSNYFSMAACLDPNLQCQGVQQNQMLWIV